MALSTDEKKLIADAFALGGTILHERGMSDEQITAFVKRPEVRDEVERMCRDYADQDGMIERTRYGARRGLAAMSRDSVKVLRDALRGPVYLTDPETGAVQFDVMGRPLVARMPPSPMQFAAAQDILTRLGVDTDADELSGADPDYAAIFARAANSVARIEYGEDCASEQDRIMSRERMRTAILKLRQRVGSGRSLLEGTVSRTFKSRRHPVRKMKAVIVSNAQTSPQSDNGSGNTH